MLKNWQKVLVVFLSWLFLVYLVSFLVVKTAVIKFAPTYPGWDTLAQNEVPTFLARLNGFDGFHYYTIATRGYQAAALIQAFFPLYPLLITLLTFVTGQPLIMSLLISICASALFLIFAHDYLAKKFNLKVAWWFVIIFLVSPASFYLVAGYNESLFLLWLILSLRFYEQKKYGWSAFFAFLLSATRIVGVILPGVLLIDYYRRYRWQKKRFTKENFWSGIIILFGVGGLLSYMFYLWQQFGDPLFFMTVQRQFGAGRETAHLILLPQVIYRYLKMFILGLPINFKWWTIVQEFLISLFYLAMLIITGKKNFQEKKEIYPWTWWLFSLGAFLIPPLTGNFSSMPRYTLVCLVVPLFWAKTLAANNQKLRFLKVVILLFSLLLMFFNLTLFLQGYFVA